MRNYKNGKRKSIPFTISMVCRDRKITLWTDFCIKDLKEINRKNKQNFQYPEVPSAIRPISHDPDLPVPEPCVNMAYSSNSQHSSITVIAGSNTYKPEEDDQQVPLTKAGLNDLRWGLDLSKESAQLLGSHLKDKRLLAPGIVFYWCRDCVCMSVCVWEREFRERERERERVKILFYITFHGESHHWIFAKVLTRLDEISGLLKSPIIWRTH